MWLWYAISCCLLSQSPPPVNTRSWELGNWGTGMLLYLAWPRLKRSANCPAPPHTHVWTQWAAKSLMHTKLQLQHTPKLAESVIHHSSPVLASATLTLSCQKLKANTNVFGSRLTCHSSPSSGLKWAGSQTLSNHQWGGFCRLRAVFWGKWN